LKEQKLSIHACRLVDWSGQRKRITKKKLDEKKNVKRCRKKLFKVSKTKFTSL
jgi:hypothetical protein